MLPERFARRFWAVVRFKAPTPASSGVAVVIGEEALPRPSKTLGRVVCAPPRFNEVELVEHGRRDRPCPAGSIKAWIANFLAVNAGRIIGNTGLRGSAPIMLAGHDEVHFVFVVDVVIETHGPVVAVIVGALTGRAV